MAEIQIERKKKGVGGWVLGILFLLILLGAGWYYMMGPDAMPIGR